jgi:hypothetical protein
MKIVVILPWTAILSIFGESGVVGISLQRQSQPLRAKSAPGQTMLCRAGNSHSGIQHKTVQ